MLGVISPYPESRHLVPSVGEVRVAEQDTLLPSNGTNATLTVTASPVEAGGGSAGYEGIMAIALSLVVLAAVLLILLRTLGPGGPGVGVLWRPGPGGPPGSGVGFLGYRYPGLKDEARRLIDAMVATASRAGARVSPGMTVREIALMASGLGLGWALEAARLYYEAMFSRRGPSRGLVDRLRRLVGGGG